MKRSAIVILALSAVVTLLGIVLHGDFSLLVSLQPYFLIGLVAVLLVAFLNTRRELASSARRDRLCLQFVHILAACVVCIGLLLTLIGLVKAIWCARHLRPDPGDIAVSLLPFLYCLVIAEVACPALAHYLDCRIERAEQAKPEANSNTTP
jgi:uncharacterized sodium:solute symporter family permease YidK